MDDDPLFKFNESTTASAKRWQKRALEAEGKVAVLESTVSERDGSIDKLIERASGYGRKVIDLETERNRLSGRVAELEAESSAGREATLGEIVEACNELADQFYRMEGFDAGEGLKFYEATHPHEVRCWRQAMAAYDHINGTDMDDVLEEYIDDQYGKGGSDG